MGGDHIEEAENSGTPGTWQHRTADWPGAVVLSGVFSAFPSYHFNFMGLWFRWFYRSRDSLENL